MRNHAKPTEFRDWTKKDRAQDIWWIAHEWMPVGFFITGDAPTHIQTHMVFLYTCMGATFFLALLVFCVIDWQMFFFLLFCFLYRIRCTIKKKRILAPQVFYENINWNYLWNAENTKQYLLHSFFLILCCYCFEWKYIRHRFLWTDMKHGSIFFWWNKIWLTLI